MRLVPSPYRSKISGSMWGRLSRSGEPVLSDASQIAALHVSTWREVYSNLLPEDLFSDEHFQGFLRMWEHILGNPREEWSIRIVENAR